MYEITSSLGVKKVPTLGDVLVYMNRRDHNHERPHEAFHSVSRDGVKLEIAIRDNYGRYGVIQKGSAQAIVEAMVREVELFYVKPGDRVFKPHEMTKNQWEAVVAVGSAVYGVYPCLTKEQSSENCTYVKDGKETKVSPTGLLRSLFYERFGYLHNGPSYDGTGQDNGRHDVHVAYALAQGKVVPPYVLAEYAERTKWPSDLRWFGAVINVPKLRGAMPLEALTTLCSLLKNADFDITHDNVDGFIALMKTFPEAHVNFVNLDDFLYEKGILKMRALPEKRAVDIGLPLNRLAEDLRNAVIELRRNKRLKHLKAERAEGRMTMREYDFQLQLISWDDGTYEYPNGIARAVQERDLAFLLRLLDTPDDQNTATKAVLQKSGILKVKGLRAEARNKAIFAFCGYDEEARDQYLLKIKEREAKKQAERAEQEAIERAEQVRYKVSPEEFGEVASDGTVSGREYVDRAIANGYDKLVKHRSGNTQYWLSNARTGRVYPLKAKVGTYDYAVIALEKAKKETETK